MLLLLSLQLESRSEQEADHGVMTGIDLFKFKFKYGIVRFKEYPVNMGGNK